ncbi:MAG: hypothetical protein JRF71_11885, partial [Deltaproteobacteria bacterium]|nr:hypothetical protein [Deltaproteobacteria bacterium]
MNLSIIKICSIVLLFVAPVALIYSNILEAPFVLDDTVRIQDNPHIRMTDLSIKEIVKAGWNKESASKRPIGNMSFALNYYFHQYNLKGYHVVNIIIHIFAGFFLFLFIKTTLSILSIESKCDHPTLIAFFSALIWLVHPVQTQSVTYIVQRLNSLAAMFYVLSFWLYVKGRLAQKKNASNSHPKKSSKGDPQPATWNHFLWFAGSVLAWILALGCKQNAATLPFFIVLYEWYFFQNLHKQWFKRHLKYFLGIFILFLFISLIYMGSDPWEKISSIGDYAKNEFTIKERALSQFRVVIYYLSLIVFPHPSRLNLDYDFPLSHSLIDPITTLLSLCIIVGLLGLAIYMAKKERVLSFCILWFLGNLVIESSVIPLAIIFEHRLYLPSMLVCLMVVIWIFRLLNQKWLGVALLCAVAMLFSFWTYERNSVWIDKVTLWKDCVQKSPNKARPHYNLGKALVARNRLSEAIDHYFMASRIN